MTQARPSAARTTVVAQQPDAGSGTTSTTGSTPSVSLTSALSTTRRQENGGTSRPTRGSGMPPLPDGA